MELKLTPLIDGPVSDVLLVGASECSYLSHDISVPTHQSKVRATSEKYEGLASKKVQLSLHIDWRDQQGVLRTLPPGTRLKVTVEVVPS